MACGDSPLLTPPLPRRWPAAFAVSLLRPALGRFAARWLPADALALSPVARDQCPGYACAASSSAASSAASPAVLRARAAAACREAYSALESLAVAQAQQAVLAALAHGGVAAALSAPVGVSGAGAEEDAAGAADAVRAQLRAMFAVLWWRGRKAGELRGVAHGGGAAVEEAGGAGGVLG